MDPLPLVAFAASTGFALTFDVGVFALARFAIRPADRVILRFALEIGVAHALLLVAGAAIPAAFKAAFELDLAVDLLALVLLTFVVAGVARRDHSTNAAAPRNKTLSWITSFALSLDALLIAPAANDVLGDSSFATRLAVLTGITLAIFGFTALYAKFASTLQRHVVSSAAPRMGRLLRVAHFAELFVFCSLWATSATKSIGHFIVQSPAPGAWSVGAGLILAILLYACGPRVVDAERTIKSP